MPEKYRIKIDQLPEELIGAADPEDASRKVRELILNEESLQRLHDDEPV